MSTALRDVLRAERRTINRRSVYRAYQGMVLEDRNFIVRWVVDKMVRRYRADLRRRDVQMELCDWIDERSTLHDTYVSRGPGGTGLATRRHWATWQIGRLIDKSMRLLEDTPSTEAEIEQLFEKVINTKHDDPRWVIKVQITETAEYIERSNNKLYPKSISLRFTLRPRPMSASY